MPRAMVQLSFLLAAGAVMQAFSRKPHSPANVEHVNSLATDPIAEASAGEPSSRVDGDADDGHGSGKGHSAKASLMRREVGSDKDKAAATKEEDQALAHESVLEEEEVDSRLNETNTAREYGFYLHVFVDPAAVIYQVRQIKKFFPGSPIYIMSDGGYSFKKLCEREGCKFEHCPPANDRWHPWPFFHRLRQGAVWLDTKYVIILENDNTIHGPIKRRPQADAGGLPVPTRHFKPGVKDFIEKLAQKRKPGFRWTAEAMQAGFTGGSYFRRDALLDAFSDKHIADLDWAKMAETEGQKVYSSDFAMQVALAARGHEVETWMDSAQMGPASKDTPLAGEADAAFKHYSRGKSNLQLVVDPKDAALFEKIPGKYDKHKSLRCHECYNFNDYVKEWGSSRCTNPVATKIHYKSALPVVQSDKGVV